MGVEVLLLALEETFNTSMVVAMSDCFAGVGVVSSDVTTCSGGSLDFSVGVLLSPLTIIMLPSFFVVSFDWPGCGVRFSLPLLHFWLVQFLLSSVGVVHPYHHLLSLASHSWQPSLQFHFLRQLLCTDTAPNLSLYIRHLELDH